MVKLNGEVKMRRLLQELEDLVKNPIEFLIKVEEYGDENLTAQIKLNESHDQFVF